jgi:peptide/nickel transport system substrate-binding protein
MPNVIPELIRAAGRSLRMMALAGAALTSVVAAAVAADLQPGEIVVAMPVLRQQFDPTAMVSTTDYLAYDLLFDGLINLRAAGKVPGLATSWTISPDGKQIDFTLRQGVKFHDGSPFTADDVKFTFDSLLSPQSRHSYRQGFQESLERVDVIDPLHVRFVLKHPWLSFFTTSRYALQPIVPKAYYEKLGAAGFAQKPIGTGPYRLVDMKPGEWSRYEANPDYWGEVHVKTITQRLVTEPFTSFAMIQRGEADITAGLTGPLFERVKADPRLHVYASPDSGTNGLFFNTTKFPAAADKRVRLAIAYAINRDEIAKKILNGVCEPATSIFTPATFGYLPGLPLTPYDPAKAKALLQEAGVAPGQEVDFVMSTDSFSSFPNAPQVLEAIAGDIEAIGFKVKRIPYESGAWLAMMRGGKQPGIFYMASSIPDDGGELINGWYTSTAVWSSGHVQVPEYDEIYTEQLAAADLAKREALLQKFAKLENERMTALPLFWCSSSFVAGPRVASWKPALGSPYQMNLNTVQTK